MSRPDEGDREDADRDPQDAGAIDEQERYERDMTRDW